MIIKEEPNNNKKQHQAQQQQDDDNEKENDLKQVTADNNSLDNMGHEEIIDGFSFLTFEYESDLKVSVDLWNI
jgi:hypothetical protein